MFDLPDSELEGVHLAEPLLVGQGGDVLPEALEGVVDALHPPPLAHVGRVPHVHLADHPPAPAELPPHLLAVKVLRPEGVRGRVWKAGVGLTSGVTSRVMGVRRVAGARAVVRVIEALLAKEIFVDRKKGILNSKLTCMKLCQASVSINCDLRVDSPGPGGIRSGDTEPYDINISNVRPGLIFNMSLTVLSLNSVYRSVCVVPVD